MKTPTWSVWSAWPYQQSNNANWRQLNEILILLDDGKIDNNMAEWLIQWMNGGREWIKGTDDLIRFLEVFGTGYESLRERPD